LQKSYHSRTALRMTVKLALGGVVGAMCLFSTTAFAEDAVSALIRRQTDASSDAGQRGDQATVNSFLDEEVLFSAGDGNVQRDPKIDKSDAVSALLKRQTQAFHNARERGDKVVMQGYLDKDVLLVDEDGVVSGRSDVQRGALVASTKEDSSSITVTNWVLHHSGDVAVSSYTADEVVRYGEQTLKYKLLSVETWIKRGVVWKLIGSQAIPLHQDPPIASLPSDLQSDYVGIYSAGPGSAVSISREGGALTSSTNGAKPVPLQAEFHDILFSPGLPPGYARPRNIFQRNANGQVTGYVRGGIVYSKSRSDVAQGGVLPLSTPPWGPLKLRDFVVHHSGNVAVATFFHDRDTPFYGQVLHQIYRSMETWIKRGVEWKMMASQGRQMLQNPSVANLSTKELDDYVGTYAAGSRRVTISRLGGELALSANGAQTVRLAPEVRDLFFTPNFPDTTVAFQRDASGRITGYVSRRDERDLVFTKA